MTKASGGTGTPEQIKSEYEQLSLLIKKHWHQSLVFFGLIAASTIAVICFAIFSKSDRPSEKDIRQLESSSRAISTAVQGIQLGCLDLAKPRPAAQAAQSPGTAKTQESQEQQRCAEFAELLSSQRLHQQDAFKKLYEQDRQPAAATSALTQIAGGTIVLAILGYLGLIRLSNLDQEIGAMRNFMFAQIETRTDDLKSTVTYEVMEPLKKVFDENAVKVENAAKEVLDTTKNQLVEIEKRATVILERVNANKQEFEDTIKRYPWLTKSDISNLLKRLENIPSAQKAHELAEELRAGDPIASTAALQAIIDNDLPGDKEDFHNAHSEAMRQMNPQLGLKLAEKGLSHFPDDFDLMADKAKAFHSLGKINEAKSLLEDWKSRKPDQFARGWRPVVTYANILQAWGLTETSIEELDQIFTEVARLAPQEFKAIGSHARFLMDAGKRERAEEVLMAALEKNPYSQELHYVYGQLLLSSGRAHDAVDHFEMAVRADYQDQFQSDVNQTAVLGMLAQAYEASQQPDKARRIYLRIADPRHVMGRYAIQRLHALDILSPMADDDHDAPSEDSIA